MKDIHKTQIQILKKLLFTPSLKFSDLKPDQDMENNLFNFHLDQLINLGLIQKKDNLYTLTPQGKEFANRMDTQTNTIQKQAKLSVLVGVTKKIKGETSFLLYTRLKQPFYGCQGLMSGKINYGDEVTQAASRELFEETNLQGESQIVGIRHYLVTDEKTEGLVEDKFMFLCLVQDPTGEIIPAEEGEYEWVPESQIYEYVTNPFESSEQFRQDISELQNFTGQIYFKEIHHFTSKF